MITFASATNALRCAVELQRVLHKRNAYVEPHERVEMRMGVNTVATAMRAMVADRKDAAKALNVNRFYVLDRRIDDDPHVDRPAFVAEMDRVTSRAIDLDRESSAAWVGAPGC